jgi:hypothetical protein
MRPALVVTLALVALAACGGGDDRPTPPPSGWIDVPGMICADGSPTGIGISRGSADAVLVYLAPGGACWSEVDCDVITKGPFGASQFDLIQLFTSGTIFDRTLAGNPFASWTHVFVPYCTGDVHLGSSVRPYAGTWQHHGYLNLKAAVARMTADVAQPAQVVVAGSSAGGFGALVAYDLVRAEWPAGAVDGALVDDSAPTFVGTTAMPQQRLDAWWDAWGLGSTLELHCQDCRSDLSSIWDELATRHQDDRLALVSTTQDFTMRSFFGDPNLEFSGPTFETAVNDLSVHLASFPNVRTFRVGTPNQEAHALLRAPALYSAGDATLVEWLGDMTRPGSDWTSKP